MPDSSTLLGFFSKIKNSLSASMKRYGILCLLNYLILYIISFSTIYYLVKVDLLSSPVDPNKYLKTFWLKKRLLGENDLPEWMIDLATTWLINKATEPVRILIIVAITPVIARFLPDYIRGYLIGKEEEKKEAEGGGGGVTGLTGLTGGEELIKDESIEKNVLQKEYKSTTRKRNIVKESNLS
jgi:hypothetical protein